MQTNSKTRARSSDLTGRLAGIADWLLRPHGEPVELDPERVRNIVILKPCCLGDMLMATPVLRSLSRTFPGASLTIVTTQWTRPAVETSPRIDRLILYPNTGGIRSTFQVAYQMRQFQFDLGVSLDRSPLTAFSLWLARIPVRAGIDSSCRGIGLTHRAIPEPGQHETALYLATLQGLGAGIESEHPEFHVPDEAVRRIDSILSTRTRGQVVVIHAGGAVNPGVEMLEKRWPATNFGELASLLSRKKGATVVLVGSDTDRNAVETVRKFANTPVIDLCGQLSLAELGALCQRASLFVGNDSGVTHLASAVGAPVVAIFGPTNPGRYRPLGRRTRICAPDASWDVDDEQDLRARASRQVPDITSVPLPQVFNACLELLGEAR